jgi:integrase
MPRKRGNGECSIYRHKDGRWVGEETEGPLSLRKARQDVAKKLTKAMADLNGGLIFDAGTLAVEEYLKRWLANSVRGTVRISTFERHEEVIRAHLVTPLGRAKFKTLTPVHVPALHREKLDAGLAPATIRKIHSTLHKALLGAVSDGLMPRNAADVKVPRPAPKEMRPLSEAEARAFLDAAKESGDRFEALYVLAITTPPPRRSGRGQSGWTWRSTSLASTGASRCSSWSQGSSPRSST